MAFVNSFVPTTLTSSSLTKSSFTPRAGPQSRGFAHIRTAPSPCPKRNSLRMLFGINLFPLADAVALPQNDTSNAGHRAREIEEAKQDYVWSRDVIGEAPMIKGCPPRDELPSIGWIEGMARTIIRIVSNNLAIQFSEAREDFNEEKRQMLSRMSGFAASVFQKVAMGAFDSDAINEVLDEVGDMFGAKAEGKGCSFQEYKDLYKVFKPDVVAKLDQFLRDDIFGMYRVAGPSPMHIRRVESLAQIQEMFPELTDDIIRGIPGFTGDRIRRMAREKRFYYVDYPEFDGVPSGTLPDGTSKEDFYLYAPTALLAVPSVTDKRTSILPVAIRCGQGSDYPMYTSNTDHTDPVTWLAAKCTVQVADGVMHETRYHLGRTHLLLEVFVCAMKRNLAPNHPLNKFLSVHFEGLAFINYLGSLRLASAGGTIDRITAPSIDATTALCVAAMAPPFSFNDWMPDKEFATRGMLDADLNYPYRDDALELWEAINEWVDAYVRAYYKSDSDVAGDTELANWCREVVDPTMGNIPGFGENDKGEVKTVAYLVRFVSALVFIGSAQHAALNFSQGALMQFVPAMPLAGFAPPPKTPKPFKSTEHFVEEMLPPLVVTQRQLNTAELLAGFQWTSLGEYGRDLNYAPDDVDEALKAFKERLSDIGSQIQKRNAEERRAGLPVYDFLVPKNIPQSANV